MTSPISNQELVNRCLRYLISDNSRAKDLIIKDAIITASREIANIGSMPLAWNKEQYDLQFSRYHAVISDITSANPCVITALSQDPATGSFPYTFDFTLPGHYFSTNDIVYFDGINGDYKPHDLNQRLFRLVYIDDETFSLKTLDGQTAIDSTRFEAYNSGGIVYHAGIVMPSAIEPTGGTASYEWDIKRVYGLEVDGQPCNNITKAEAVRLQINRPGPRPYRWRYQQYAYGTFSSDEHIVLWYPYPSQRYNINFLIEKDYPDISVWDTDTYPPHPPFIHDFIWHRALANLSTHSETARRRFTNKNGDVSDNTKMEVVNAKYWIEKSMIEERKIIDHSQMMDGNQPYISKGMIA